MRDYINMITGKIVTSKLFKKIKDTFASFKTQPIVTNATENVDGVVNNSTVSNPFDTFGNFIADKIKKIIKHFGKKFKNESKAESVISKTVSTVTKVVCTVATIAFAALVIYAFIKLIPTLIYMTAILAATYIGIEIILGVLNRGLGVN